MPIPKNVTFVTFDVYGTLIDWETGIYEAFAKEAERDGFEIDRAVLIPLFHEISREIEGGSYELRGGAASHRDRGCQTHGVEA